MQKHLILFLTLISAVTLTAQDAANIVMHLQSADTVVHRSLVNQIGNLKKEMPNAQIEVVCHGPGLEFLMKENSTYINRIDRMKLTGVSFVGCEFTMSQRNVKKEDLVPFAKTVPYGLAEIIRKQQADWIYVKLGF